MPMTPRERWLALFRREKPDRVPTCYRATNEFHQKLVAATGCRSEEELSRRLHIDRPRRFGPRHRVGHHPDDSQANIWGLCFQNIDYGTGVYAEVANHPLADVTTAEQVHAYRWPSPKDLDYERMARALDEDDGYRVRAGGGYEPFLLYCQLRGLERGFMDLLEEPEIVDAIMGHIFDYCYENLRRILEIAQGRIDFTDVSEDLGSQTGPLMSLESYRRFLRPRQMKMAQLAHDHGVYVDYHTDGAARPFLDDLVNVVKIDILNPIQWRCPGMDREGLVRDYGDKIIFLGAMDNQQTLPFGSVEDVRQEVRENREYFRGARWICAPCHNIQAVTPVQNVIAMYQAIHEIGAER